MSKPTGNGQTPPDEPDEDDIAKMLEEMSRAEADGETGGMLPEGFFDEEIGRAHV